MAYWDEIDELCENFTREFLAFSLEQVDVDDDDITILQNEIRDFAVQLFENNTTAKFPFVNENY